MSNQLKPTRLDFPKNLLQLHLFKHNTIQEQPEKIESLTTQNHSRRDQYGSKSRSDRGHANWARFYRLSNRRQPNYAGSTRSSSEESYVATDDKPRPDSMITPSVILIGVCVLISISYFFYITGFVFFVSAW